MKIKYVILTILCFAGIYFIWAFLNSDSEFEDIESILKKHGNEHLYRKRFPPDTCIA